MLSRCVNVRLSVLLFISLALNMPKHFKIFWSDGRTNGWKGFWFCIKRKIHLRYNTYFFSCILSWFWYLFLDLYTSVRPSVRPSVLIMGFEYEEYLSIWTDRRTVGWILLIFKKNFQNMICFFIKIEIFWYHLHHFFRNVLYLKF